MPVIRVRAGFGELSLIHVNKSRFKDSILSVPTERIFAFCKTDPSHCPPQLEILQKIRSHASSFSRIGAVHDGCNGIRS